MSDIHLPDGWGLLERCVNGKCVTVGTYLKSIIGDFMVLTFRPLKAISEDHEVFKRSMGMRHSENYKIIPLWEGSVTVLIPRCNREEGYYRELHSTFAWCYSKILEIHPPRGNGCWNCGKSCIPNQYDYGCNWIPEKSVKSDTKRVEK